MIRPSHTILQGTTSSNHHPDLICCLSCLLQPLRRPSHSPCWQPNLSCLAASSTCHARTLPATARASPTSSVFALTLLSFAPAASPFVSCLRHPDLICCLHASHLTIVCSAMSSFRSHLRHPDLTYHFLCFPNLTIIHPLVVSSSSPTHCLPASSSHSRHLDLARRWLPHLLLLPCLRRPGLIYRLRASHLTVVCLAMPSLPSRPRHPDLT
jgi:hypothetical protein